jgi:hypothetical protein
MIEVEEPLIVELIDSPAFQRLKLLHQYGVSYYISHSEEYNRYDHSLGVFTILREKGASLEEQISGLLHDISHTAFSHVGDWVFGRENQEEDYQTKIYRSYLATSGIEKILNKYGYTVEQVDPKYSDFLMLEQPLPTLCADRIDYNIQGAFFQNFLTKEEALELFHDLVFKDGQWLLTKKDLATKLMRFSLFMTENCWGSALNHLSSRWLADAILQAVKINLISWNDFHFGTDDALWEKLQSSTDPLITHRMSLLTHPTDFFHLVAPAQSDLSIKFKFRGIDPWILFNDNIVLLSSLEQELAKAFQKTKEQASIGWPIEILVTKGVMEHLSQ